MSGDARLKESRRKSRESCPSWYDARMKAELLGESAHMPVRQDWMLNQLQRVRAQVLQIAQSLIAPLARL